MIRILTGVKVRHAACGAILRQITASKGSKGSMASFVYVIYENTNGSRGRDLAILLNSRVRQHACATMEDAAQAPKEYSGM